MLPMSLKKTFYLKIFALLLMSGLFLGGKICVAVAQTQQAEKELFLVAQKAFEDGFYDVSMRYIDQLFKEYPQTQKRVQANLLLGQCYFFKTQYIKAYDVFQNLLQYNEFKDATIFWLGETYLKGADYKQAEKQYQQLIEVYPNSVYLPQAYYSLGWLHFEQGHLNESNEFFLKVMRDFPTHELAEDAAFKLAENQYNLKNYATAIQYFKNHILRYPQSTRQAQGYFYIGESYFYLGDSLTAITYYAKAGELSYDNKLSLMAKVSLGWSYLKLEKFNLAQQYFDEALKFSKDKGMLSDDVYLGQATLYSEMKNYAQALDAYTQLIQNFPNSSRAIDAYLGKANIYYILKNYPDAIKNYQNILNEFAKTGKNETAGRQEILEKASFGLAWSEDFVCASPQGRLPRPRRWTTQRTSSRSSTRTAPYRAATSPAGSGP